jgi:tetratricopeptide (TPR) repeat protein
MCYEVPSRLRFFIITICLLVVLLTGSLAGQQSQHASDPGVTSSSLYKLEVGKTITREMRGGESHEYQFLLGAEKYAHFEIDQRSIDLAFAMSAPDGRQILEGNLTYPGELEKASIISEGAGIYRIRVWPVDNAAAGQYEITFTEMRDADDTLKHRTAAEHAMAEGMAMYFRQSADEKRGAIAKYAEALEHWRAAGNSQGEALTLSMMGSFYSDLGEKQKALELAKQALTLAR